MVGYSSVGTFSSRFKTSVGLSPTVYRQLGGFMPQIVTTTQRPGACTAVVQGVISPPLEEDEQRMIYVGLFPDPVSQGRPVRCTVLDESGPFRFEGVPAGTWHLLAQSVRPGEEEGIGAGPPIVGSRGPITVRPGLVVEALEIELRSVHSLDPRVLLALPDARPGSLTATVS